MAQRHPLRPGARIRRTLLIIAAVLPLCRGGSLFARDPSTPAPDAWSYTGKTGPAHWADLAPAFATCREGQSQSPIDIRTVQRIPYEPLHFRYHTQTLEVVNDGRGVHVLSSGGSTLELPGETFDLTSLHFHSPGETLINGVAAAAEVHLVHRSSTGRFAIVAVQIQPGRRTNQTLARIVERLPLHAGERLSYRQVGINPLLLLPADQGYFTYTGSLANPPCSEPAAWYILAQPVGLDPEQIRRLAAAAGVNNVRPVQPLNGRSVYASLRH